MRSEDLIRDIYEAILVQLPVMGEEDRPYLTVDGIVDRDGMLLAIKIALAANLALEPTKTFVIDGQDS
jgi:hypothetical protein